MTLDRVERTGAGTRLRAETRAEFPGARGRAYRALVIDSRFHVLAVRRTELVCGLNVEFVGGMAAGLGCAGLAINLEPSPGRCCVSARRESARGETGATATG